MAGQPGRSGGANRIAPELHIARGTFRPSRHRPVTVASSRPLSKDAREDELRGLSAPARKLAAQLLDEFSDGWDAAALVTLRLYAESAAKLDTLKQNTPERRRETRLYLQLLAALDLGR